MNLKKIFLSILIFSLLPISLFAENSDVTCKTTFQTTSTDALWKCPSLDIENNAAGEYPLTHELLNIGFDTGSYTCVYRYKDSGKQAQSCTYMSSEYIAQKRAIENNLHGVTAKGSGKGIFATFTPLDIESDFNMYGVTKSPPFISKIQTKLNTTIGKLKAIDSARKVPNSSLSKTETVLENIEKLTYKGLVEPYYKPSMRDAFKKEATFSNFLAGMVTLNDSMVTGYDGDSGKLKIDPSWKSLATSTSQTQADFYEDSKKNIGSWWNSILNFFGAGTSAIVKDALNESVSDGKGGEIYITVSSWLDMFELKLWGFYYNVQKRFDLGYDVISTQLLYLMTMWFILLGGTKAGAGHILNREQRFRMTEENWMKALTIITGISVFYISLSTPLSPSATTGTKDDSSVITTEMNKNKTIMKYLIRESADKGANFGTMMSDLGLDAFLTFVVKKQKVYSGYEVSRIFYGNVENLKMLYPAYDILSRCEKYYGVGEKEFYNSNSAATFTKYHDPDWGGSKYATNNNISSLSYSVCRKAKNIVATTPYDMFYASAETEERIDKVDPLMAKAVYQLAVNNIAIQSRMGWVNSFSVPLTYFLMKDGDMFLSKGLDYGEIEERVSRQTKTLGLKDSTDLFLDSDEMAEQLRAGYGAASDKGQKAAAWVSSAISNLMIYNILPGFTSMRQGIAEYLDKIYDSKLQLYANDAGGKDNSMKGILGNLVGKSIGFIPKMLGGAATKMLGLDSGVENVVFWRTLILLSSFMLAIYAWKMTFSVIFMSAISILILLKTVLYFKDLMVHVITSVFVLVWAFTKQGGQGEGKMAHFGRDTVILMMYPTLIVLGTYTFIFVYEMFMVIYNYLMLTMLSGQEYTVSLMGAANSDTDSFSSYLAIESVRQLSEIVAKLFGFIIAVATITKFPETVLQKLGLTGGDTMVIGNMSQEVGNKGEKFVSPL